MKAAPWLVAAGLISLLLNPCRAGGFSVRSRTISPPEMGTLTCYDITVGAERYSLVPPYQWGVEADAGTRMLRFRSPGKRAVIEIVFAPPGRKTSAESVAIRASGDSAGAQMRERFTTVTGLGEGEAVDVTWTILGASMCARAVVVPLPRHNVEFVLTCGTADFNAMLGTLGGIMTSLQPASQDTARLRSESLKPPDLIR